MSRLPIRVLIVDDSAMVRKMLCGALEGETDIEVVGTAPDPFVAREKILSLQPDVLTLDIEMPRMDGITFLRKLMNYKPMPVIIISSLGDASCQAGLDALRAGAVELMVKPHGPYSIGDLGATLASKIRAAAQSRVRPSSPQPGLEADRSSEALLSSAQQPGSDITSPLPPSAQRRIVAIGASTGGPQAIAELLQAMPADSPPVLLTQHMPPIFTRHLADRLHKICRIAVKEAEDGDEVLPGRALVAPGNLHMALQKLNGQYRVRVVDGPPVCYSRPSVDVLFDSVAEAAGRDALGVLLTGMGTDGAQGLLRMRKRGASTIAQNEETCIVFGMPKEAIRLGAAGTVLPLDRIASKIICLMRDASQTTFVSQRLYV